MNPCNEANTVEACLRSLLCGSAIANAPLPNRNGSRDAAEIRKLRQDMRLKQKSVRSVSRSPLHFHDRSPHFLFRSAARFA